MAAVPLSVVAGASPASARSVPIEVRRAAEEFESVFLAQIPSRAPFGIPLAIRQDRVSVASALRPAAARLPAIGSGRERRPLG